MYKDRVFTEIQFLTGSHNRVRVLHRLREQPATGYELEESLNVSRATVTRALSEFRERGWVRRTGPQYVITDFGVVVANAVDQLFETMETVLKLDCVREWLPLDDIDFEVSRLGDVELVLSFSEDPFNTIRHLTDHFRTAESVRMIAAVLLPESLEAAAGALEDSNTTFEAVVSLKIIDAIRSDLEFQERFADVIRRDSVRLYRCEDSLPNYSIVIADDCLLLHLFDENGMPRALIECGDEAAIEWGNNKFTMYRDKGELVNFEYRNEGGS